MYICRIWSNSTPTRLYYGINTKSAMKAAKELGRCEGGEVVEIITPQSQRVISAVRWTPEDGGRYYRCKV